MTSEPYRELKGPEINELIDAVHAYFARNMQVDVHVKGRRQAGLEKTFRDLAVQIAVTTFVVAHVHDEGGTCAFTEGVVNFSHLDDDGVPDTFGEMPIKTIALVGGTARKLDERALRKLVGDILAERS